MGGTQASSSPSRAASVRQKKPAHTTVLPGISIPE